MVVTGILQGEHPNLYLYKNFTRLSRKPRLAMLYTLPYRALKKLTSLHSDTTSTQFKAPKTGPRYQFAPMNKRLDPSAMDRSAPAPAPMKLPVGDRSFNGYRASYLDWLDWIGLIDLTSFIFSIF